METKDLLEQLIKEVAAHNRLTALQIARQNVDTWNKSDTQIIEEMKEISDSIIEWSYLYPQKEFPLNAVEMPISGER